VVVFCCKAADLSFLRFLSSSDDYSDEKKIQAVLEKAGGMHKV
jgi:hypothetical protein